MDTTLDQLKVSASIAAHIEAKTGIWFPPSEVWRAIYATMRSLGQSAKDAALAVLSLRRAAQSFRHDPNFRDGSKNRPLKFKDIARRITV